MTLCCKLCWGSVTLLDKNSHKTKRPKIQKICSSCFRSFSLTNAEPANEEMSSSPQNGNETKLENLPDDILHRIFTFLHPYSQKAESLTTRTLISRHGGNDVLSLSKTCTSLLKSVRSYFGIQLQTLDAVFPLTYHLPVNTIIGAALYAPNNMEETSTATAEVNEREINKNTVMQLNNSILFVCGHQLQTIRLSRFVNSCILNNPSVVGGLRELHLNDGGVLDVAHFTSTSFPCLSKLSVGNPSEAFLQSLMYSFPTSSIKILSFHNFVISLLPLLLKSFQSTPTKAQELNIMHLMPHPSTPIHSRISQLLLHPSPNHYQISNFIHRLFMCENDLKRIRISAIQSMTTDIGKCCKLIMEHLDIHPQIPRGKYTDILQIQMPYITNAYPMVRPEPFVKLINVDIFYMLRLPANRIIWNTLTCTLSVAYRNPIMSMMEAKTYMHELEVSKNNYEIHRLILTYNNPIIVSTAPIFEFLSKYVMPVLKNEITIHIPFYLMCSENHLYLIQFLQNARSENVRAFVMTPPNTISAQFETSRNLNVMAFLTNLEVFLRAVFMNCKRIQAVAMETALSEIGFSVNIEIIDSTVQCVRQINQERPEVDLESLKYCLSH